MAREPGPNEVRFPLRRQADAELEPPAPKPEPKSWRPRPAREEPLELSGGMPPPDAEPILQRVRRAVLPPSPPPPPPPPDYGAAALAGGYSTNLPVAYKKRSWKWLTRSIAALVVLFIAAVAWLALTAPLSKSLQPPVPPSITLLSAEGKEIARRGAVIGAPVDAARLPKHVRDAFIAIEDRRFYSHMGVDPRGILRAFVHNITSDDRSQGGSTITQQLAKNAFLSSDRTMARKAQEVLIAFWLEGWLSKDEILSRYLSNVYFGDNVYGLSAAAQHYFSVDADELSVSQATMLAGLVQAPSRLAPTGNLKGARDRQKLVIGAMVSAGLLTKQAAAQVKPAVLKVSKERELPNGTYFADWVLPQARDRAGEVATEQTVRTTLEVSAQQAAERAVRNAGLNKSQVAIVAMRPDGRVIAMVGGKNYAASPFNRATQARRQPGSTFKLFVYLAALRAGMTPDTVVDDSPVQIGDWKPSNSDGRYAGRISLRQAFAKSSNVVAARLTHQVGVRAVTQAARDLGISTPIGADASIGLGTSTVSLLELTAAYAAVANGSYPVRPQGLSDDEAASDWLARRLGAPQRFSARQLDQLRELLSTVVESGTGRGAALPIPTFGKTGTTQDNRDALFIGYAGGIVTGVWLGNDDNSPNPGLSGSGLPARIWRDFMTRALDLRIPPPEPTTEPDNFTIDLGELVNGVSEFIDGSGIRTEVLPIDPEQGEAPIQRDDAEQLRGRPQFDRPRGPPPTERPLDRPLERR
ncbi:transglycosylase domain-containing protein [Sphingomonas soli]|uniref:transglycosylase domain-containing protein n=1 Tax=Sphingomonas soli TaxID=266127 RepID=UPI00082E10DE|nr:PBP1A family penicillin-binding protein [Sphingomonas soli]